MNTAPEILSTAFRMLTALGIVLGGLLVCVYFIKRFLRKEVSGSNKQLIKVIASQYIGIKKSISLVEIPGSILVVGVTSDRICLLTKIEDKTVLNVSQRENSRVESSFSDHLQRLTGRFKPAQGGERRRV
jgi:flagellar biosynthetic protein FliO